MLINMLKKQYHEMNQDNLKMKTKIKKVRKEHEKVAREVRVMKDIREDGQLDSAENQERRRRMLLETEWKQKIKRKAVEIEKVVDRLKNVKKEMKNDNLRHLEKELKFYCNLNKNLEKEVRERTSQLEGVKEKVRKELREKRADLQAKVTQVLGLKERIKGLVAEKYQVKRDFNQLILDEEMKMEGLARKPKRKPKCNQAENLERVRLKESIKQQIEDIQGQEEQHRQLFCEDEEVDPLQGLHYTKKNEILLNIDCETEMDEDVLFYLKGGRNLELYLELEGISQRVFLKNLKSALRVALSKEPFKKETLVKKMGEKKHGKVPRSLARVVAEVAEMVVESKACKKEKKNKKIKISQKKKMVEKMESSVEEYFKANLQYRVFFPRGGEENELKYLQKINDVQKKLAGVQFDENSEGRGEEAWIRYLLITEKDFRPEEASLVIGCSFWNTKESEDIHVDDLKRHVKKYAEYLDRRARKRQKEREDRELEEAAVKIQSVFKGKKARKEIEKKKEEKKQREEEAVREEVIEEEVIEEEVIEEEIPEVIKEIEVQQKIEEEVVEGVVVEKIIEVPVEKTVEVKRQETEEEVKEVKDEIDWEKEEEKAALLIQGRFRQKKAKEKVEEMRKQKEEKEQEQAAILIQGRFRQKKAKEEMEKRKKEREEEEAAATLIQKRYKEKMARRRLSQQKSNLTSKSKSSKSLKSKSSHDSHSAEAWSGGGDEQFEGFKPPIFTTTNLNTNNVQGVGMNNRTSVNFVRQSMKTNDIHDYSELILEEDEIDYSDEDGEELPRESLGIMMKVRINNKSYADNLEDPEITNGMNNADSDLQYNNQYFEDRLKKQREVMYSNLTRLSIRKIVKKMEGNIMRKINQPAFET